MSGRAGLASLADEVTKGQRTELVVGGLFGGLISTSLAIALAGLVFDGRLAGGLATAISASLLGGSVIAVVVALGSRAPGMIAGVQDVTAAVIAVATMAVATKADAGSEVATAFTAVGVTTLALGLAFWLAGRWRLGRVLRFVPYPVVLGFVGASGIVLLEGAVSVLTPVEGESALSQIAVFAPGIILGVLLFVAARWIASRYALPLAILGTGLLVHLWVVADRGRDSAVDAGWFLGPFDESAGLDFLVMDAVFDADWGTIAGQSGVLLTAIAVGLVAFLLNAPAVAETTGVEVDVDADMVPTGVANLAAGLVGSLPGYLVLADTVAVHKVTGSKRLSGVLVGLTGLIVLIAGTRLFSLIPTALVGGVLAFIALNFLYDALVVSFTALPKADYVLIAAMTLGVLVSGFGVAIVLGLIGSIVLFVLRYAQIDVVSREMDTMHYPGLVDRSPDERALLEQAAGSGRIIELSGFVFFGTARQIAERIAHVPPQVRFLIVDLSRVTGIDSSAAATMRKAFGDLPATLVISGADPDMLSTMPEPQATFDDAAHAVTWVEEQLLGQPEVHDHPFRELLMAHGPRAVVDGLLGRFDSRELEPGAVVVAEGEIGAGLFYIESGICVVTLASSTGTVPIRRLHAGTFVGEISLYDSDNRATASVVAESRVVGWHLSPDRLAELDEVAPAEASLLHRLVASTLAHRLRYANSMIRTLRSGRSAT